MTTEPTFKKRDIQKRRINVKKTYLCEKRLIKETTISNDHRANF